MKLPVYLHHLFRVFARSILVALSLFLLSTGITALADTITLPTLETHLSGQAWEVNPGASGRVWVSGYLAEELKSFKTDGSLVTIYNDLGDVSDARESADGEVWFLSQDTPRLGRMDTVTGVVTYWPLPGGAYGFATTIDNQGRIWISDDNIPSLYRFNPQTSEMCSLDFESVTEFGTEYLIFNGQSTMFSNLVDNAIMQWDDGPETLTVYSPRDNDWGFSAGGLVSDGDGGVWFADSYGAIGHLDLSVTGGKLYRYFVPDDVDTPAMLTNQDGYIWYTGTNTQDTSTLGRMDPINAEHSEIAKANTIHESLDFVCDTVSSSSGPNASISTRIPTWAANEVSEDSPVSTGWTVFSYDVFPTYGGLYGITYHDGTLWVVDNARNKLIRHIPQTVEPPSNRVYLPLIIK